MRDRLAVKDETRVFENGRLVVIGDILSVTNVILAVTDVSDDEITWFPEEAGGERGLKR